MMNPHNIQAYLQNQAQGLDDAAFLLRGPIADEWKERLIGLTERLETQKAGVAEHIGEGTREALGALEELDLISDAGDRWLLTGHGQFWSYTIARLLGQSIEDDTRKDRLSHGNHKHSHQHGEHQGGHLGHPRGGGEPGPPREQRPDKHHEGHAAKVQVRQ
jgi:hypothetical protein